MKIAINPRFYRGFFRIKSWVTTGLIALSLSFFVSCQEYDSIGLELIENRLQLNSTDTITLVAYSQSEDSLLVNAADLHLLGFINDPLFGKTRASIYTEILPAALPVSVVRIPRDSLVIDSVVLGLGYAGYAGKLGIEHNIRVFELFDTIPRTNIYSNRSLRLKNEILVNNPTFIPLPRDTVFLGTDSTVAPPHLRVNLDPEFGRRFITQMDSLALINSGFTNNDQFRGYLKGLYITVEETQQPGTMMYFNLNSTFSRVQIYYRKLDSQTQSIYQLSMGGSLLGRKYSHFDNFDHENTSGALREQVLDGNRQSGDSILYLQSMANYRVKIELPYLNQLTANQNDDVAINSARLIIPLDQNFFLDSIDLARSLILYREDPEKPGVMLSLPDQFMAPGYFGGTLDAVKKEYSFNISQHLQTVFDNPENNTPLYLRISGSFQNAGKVALNGVGRSNPLRLEIKYTQPGN